MMGWNRKWRNRIYRDKRKVAKHNKHGRAATKRMVHSEFGLTRKGYDLWDRFSNIAHMNKYAVKDDLTGKDFHSVFVKYFNYDKEEALAYLKTLGWFVEDTIKILKSLSVKEWFDIRNSYLDIEDKRNWCIEPSRASLAIPYLFVKGYIVSEKYNLPFYWAMVQVRCSEFISPFAR